MTATGKNLKPLEILFSEGDLGDTAYSIEKGELEVSKLCGSEKVIIGYRGKGEIIGEMALVQDLPRMATITAVNHAIVVPISEDNISEELGNSPILIQRMMGLLFNRLRESAEELVELSRLVSSHDVDSEYHAEEAIKLSPQTTQSRRAMNSKEVWIEKFPFKIGRYANSLFDKIVNRNDLYVDDSSPFQISRSHVKVDWREGRYLIIDQGSQHGAEVNGKRIGKGARDSAVILTSGSNDVVLGNKKSKYRFKILI